MFVLTSETQSVLEEAIVQAAKLYEHQQCQTWRRFQFRFFNLGDFDASYPDLCVQYNDEESIQSEYMMLQYLSTLASEDGDAERAPHVHRPIHYFFREEKDDICWGFIVMERIELREVPETELLQKTAEAVRWLRSKGPPPGTVLGSIGGPARHSVFKFFEAPLQFRSVHALEVFLNQAVHHLTKGGFLSHLKDISFANERVVLTQSIMDRATFGVARTDGRPVIFEPLTIQALPLTLANTTLLYTSRFSIDVAKYLFDEQERASLEASSNMQSLLQVQRILKLLASETLGLDEEGDNVMEKRKARAKQRKKENRKKWKEKKRSRKAVVKEAEALIV